MVLDAKSTCSRSSGSLVHCCNITAPNPYELTSALTNVGLSNSVNKSVVTSHLPYLGQSIPDNWTFLNSFFQWCWRVQRLYCFSFLLVWSDAILIISMSQELETGQTFLHLAGFSLKPDFSVIESTFSTRVSCSCIVEPHIRMSSKYIVASSMSFSNLLMTLRNISGAQVTPKGSYLLWVI